ncbi:major tail protein [Paenibacillus lentus]|uniref:major tail protein n=1 Tax=Paenibacillus lentus TaxID=1338368 RepID=UPI00365A80F1
MAKILKGFKGLGIFPITKNDAQGYTVGEKVPVNGAQSLSMEPDTEEWSIPADDGVYESGSDLNGYGFKLTIAELPLEIRSHFEGGEYDKDTGVYSYYSDTVAPEIGISFQALTSDGNYRMYKVYALRCNAITDVVNTKGSGDSATAVEITGKITQRKTDNKVKDMKDSVTAADLAWLDELVSTAPTP